MTARFPHLALHVRDLDACVRFYSAYAGMHIVRERGAGEERVVWLAERGRERGARNRRQSRLLRGRRAGRGGASPL